MELIHISYVQFAMICLMTVFAAVPFMVKIEGKTHPEFFFRSRLWLLGCPVLLVIHFTLQFVCEFRAMGPMQAALMNLFFYPPAMYCFFMSALYMLKNGEIRKREYFVGLGLILLIYAILLSTLVFTDHKLLEASDYIHTAEVIAAVVYCAGLMVYFTYVDRELRRVKKTLISYYDTTKAELLKWIKKSCYVVGISILLSPVAMFLDNELLFIYGIIMILAIPYYITNYTMFWASNGAEKIEEAENNVVESQILLDESESIGTMKQEDYQRVEKLVNQWVGELSFKQEGLTMPEVCKMMNLSRRLFAAYLRTTEYFYFQPWLTAVRLNHAKELISQGKDYSNEAIAKECGFKSRTHFQKVFRESTGMTPLQWAQRGGNA